MQEKIKIVDLTEDFAVHIIKYVQELKKKGHFEIGNQLIRSGTSIGANVAEAQDAESKADFKHKMSIANKEASETRFWLVICTKSEYLPTPTSALFEELIVIRKVLGKICATLRKQTDKDKG